MNTTISKIIRIFLAVIFYWIGGTVAVHAATSVSGIIPDGTIWNKAGSPYLSSDQIIVPAGSTLTIEPGTTVKLGNGSNQSIEVYGTINAAGIESDPIVFTSWKDDSVGGDTNLDGTANAPAFQDWDSIHMQPGSTGNFLNTIIKYGSITGSDAPITIDHVQFQWGNVFFLGGSEPVAIRNSTFSDARNTAISVNSNTAFTIENTTIARAGANAVSLNGSTVSLSQVTISDMKPGQYSNAVQLLFDSVLTVKDSVFDGGAIGIRNMGRNTLTVSDSTIKNFSKAGIYDDDGVMLVSYAQRPTIATASFSASPASSEYDPHAGATITVSHSELTKNGYGIVTRDASTTAIRENSIHGNQHGAKGISFENNWWGDASGPHDAAGNPSGKGDEASEVTHYAPWLTADPLLAPVVTCCSSVAFLPGIEASRLYSGAQQGAKLWEPFGNADVKKLYMDGQGKSIDPSIYTKDILESFKAFGIGGPTIYANFIKEMDGMVSAGTIKEWKALPYDWRQAVTDVVENGVKTQNGVMDMALEIEALAANSSTGKVTIIAHSNGGLVAKALMMKLEASGKADLVDKIVFVAVPQLGTPDALKVLQHGMNLGYGFVMSAQVAREFAENVPGAYGLIPSHQYFETVTDPVIAFDGNADTVADFIQNYGSAITTESKLIDFLLGKEGRTKPSSLNLNAPNILNETLVNQAQQLHDRLDNWQPPQGIALVQIAGWGGTTIKGIQYVTKYPCTKLIVAGLCKPYLDEIPMNTIEGDKTVVYPSAISASGDKEYFDLRAYNTDTGKNYEHKNIVEAKPVLDFIKKQITGDESAEAYITNTKPDQNDAGDMIQIAMHSPASIDLYDSHGNHTGLLSNQTNPDVVQYEENIPNSYYMEFGEGKYAGFSGDTGGSVKIQGTGAGTFTVVLDHRTGDTVTKTETFADIPVTPQAKAELVLSQTGTDTLSLDVDGNGTQDFTVQPTGSSPDDTIDPTLFLQIMKQTVHSMNLPSAVEKRLTQKIDNILKLIAKDKKKKKGHYIKQFSRMVEEKHWKRAKKLSPEQRDGLIEMIDKLMDTMQ